MRRLHQILLGVLAVQVALSVIVFWPRSAASEAAVSVFPDVDAEDIVALTLADDQTNELVLRKVDGAWVLPDVGNYPVTEATLSPVLDKLASLTVGTVVARTETSHQQLQVAEDDFVRRVTYELADGTTHTLYLGSAPRYTATHVRVAGEPETYLTTQLSAWEFNTSVNSWIDTAYINIDQATLTTVTLENGQGTFIFLKEGEAWTLEGLAEGEEPATSQISAVVRNASNMTMQQPLGTNETPAYGLDEPSAVVTLQTEEGTTHVITVGAPNANGYVVKYSESPYYVRVAQYTVQEMVENGRDDFIAPPPTPESEASPPDSTEP